MAYTKADKDGLVPMKRDDKQLSVPSFPLEQINVVQLAKELSTMLNKPSPKTWIGQYFLDKKLKFEQSKLSLLTSYVEQVRTINQSITNMQAELFLQPEVLRRIIDGNADEAKRLAELQFAEHKNAVSKHEDEMKAREIQLEAGNLANLRAKAEINLLKAKTKEAHAKADLVKYVVENIDLKNMPPLLQSFVIQSIINPHGQGNATDLELQGELKQYIKQEREAQAGKAVQEMRKVKADADMAEMDVDRNKRNMEKLK